MAPACHKASVTFKPFEPIEESANLYPMAKGGKWGYMDQTGKIRIEPQFDNASDFKEGVAVVWTNKQTFLIGKSGLIFTDPHIALMCNTVSEGMVMAAKASWLSGGWGFINTKGEIVMDFKFYICLPFSEGLAVANVNGKVGYIDKSGNWVIKPQFGPLSYPFYDGLAMVTVIEGESRGKRGFIDKEGNFVIKPIYAYAKDFSDGLAKVTFGTKDDPGWKFIRPDGSVAFTLNSRYDCFGKFSEGFSVVHGFDNGKSGFINKQGEAVIAPQFDEANDFSEGLAAVKVEGKWGYIDKTGKVVIEPLYSSVRDFHNGLALVYIDDKMAYINKAGEYIWGPEEHGVKPLISPEKAKELKERIESSPYIYHPPE